MKNWIIIGLLLLSGCAVESAPEVSNLQYATLEIKEMTCVSCALGVEYQFKQLDGVVDAVVSYETGIAEVSYDPDKITPEEIAQASDVYPASVK